MTPQPQNDPLHPTVRAYVQNKKMAADYDTHFAENPLFQYDCQFISDHIQPPGRVLDLGCGTGRHLTYLSGLGFTCLGLDLSPYFIAEAQANLAASHCPAHLIQCDIHQPPLQPDATFDAVLMMFSLLGLIRSHALRVQVLRTYASHLAPGGVLLAHAHNREFGLSLLRRTSRRVQYVFTSSEDGEPGDRIMPGYRGLQDLFLHSFSQHELVSLFLEAGLKPITFTPLNIDRDGPCTHTNAPRFSNGFLIAARRVRTDDTANSS